MNDERIRQAFARSAPVTVRITTDGFEIADDTHPALVGRVRKVSLVRKLFEDDFLACSSSDGITGSGGKLCEECQHPACQPRLRLQLVAGAITYLLELNASSARNYFAMEDRATAEGVSLGEWPLELTTVSHGYWSEVRFERC